MSSSSSSSSSSSFSSSSSSSSIIIIILLLLVLLVLLLPSHQPRIFVLSLFLSFLSLFPWSSCTTTTTCCVSFKECRQQQRRGKRRQRSCRPGPAQHGPAMRHSPPFKQKYSPLSRHRQNGQAEHIKYASAAKTKMRRRPARAGAATWGGGWRASKRSKGDVTEAVPMAVRQKLGVPEVPADRISTPWAQISRVPGAGEICGRRKKRACKRMTLARLAAGQGGHGCKPAQTAWPSPGSCCYPRPHALLHPTGTRNFRACFPGKFPGSQLLL